jgi:hypothetical protein
MRVRRVGVRMREAEEQERREAEERRKDRAVEQQASSRVEAGRCRVWSPDVAPAVGAER